MRRWKLALIAAAKILAACGRVDFDALGAADGPQPNDGSRAATWTLVQTHGQTSLPVDVQPTSAGDLVVVIAKLQIAEPLTSVFDNAPGGSSAYNHIPSAESSSASVGDHIEVWFTPSAKVGATTVSMIDAGGASFVYGVVVWEVSGLANNAVEAGGGASDMVASSLVTGPTVNLTKGGEFVVSGTIGDTSIAGMHTGNDFVRDVASIANGWAHLPANATTTGPHHAEWDSSSGPYCATVAAFGP